MARNRSSRYQQMARATAAKYGIPPKLFLSLVDHESGWNPSAVSHAGAVGLAQLMPATARGMGVDPFDPRQNLDGGARYLSTQYRKLGSWRDALRAYNFGPGGAASDPQNGAEYADAVLAGRNAAASIKDPTAVAAPGIKAPLGTFSKLPGQMTLEQMTKLLFPKNKQMLSSARQLGTPGQKFAVPSFTPMALPGVTASPAASTPGYAAPAYARGGFLQLPTSWKPTSHAGNATSNLGWGPTGPADIMASAGTRVGAPVDGVVERHGSAQGGSSMYFRGDDGRTYWLGHISNMVPAGTRVKRGQVIALVSSQHANPHVHIDAH